MGFIIYWQNTAEHFNSFEIRYIPQEVFNRIKDKSITHNISRIQDNESAMCRFYCIAFIEYDFFSFNYYLAVPQPALGHSSGDSLTNAMLIMTFSTILTQNSSAAS